MGKERMKMQENMNPAPEGAQTPGGRRSCPRGRKALAAQADMLVLIDTVADSSRDVKLIDGDTLFERFAKRASVAEAPRSTSSCAKPKPTSTRSSAAPTASPPTW